ncbi:hypothetical protein [Pseudodesulfovibrio pelocollis]|uniref:hypothetical protein n=1 Tax=Pseudodesulfovibrio pelocollis TaxID=3051432 RepID=UPI00255AB312|nr:hypothetical protein [Pseudodesulfovibrio sp. SB368]
MSSYQLSLFSESGGGSQKTCSSALMHVGGLTAALKACMQSALASAAPHLSRAQLVDRMNEIARQSGVKITSGRTRLLTANILDKWLAPNDTDDIPPLMAVEVFMLAIGNFAPLGLLAEFHGCKLLTPEEALLYEYGKAKFESKERTRQLRKLESELVDTHKRRR